MLVQIYDEAFFQTRLILITVKGPQLLHNLKV